MRIRDYGIHPGQMPTGPLNAISDVKGVTVGHCTVVSDRHNTGVTVVMPCEENPFTHKLPCAAFVLNGFGKTAGLVQIDELGTLETPIALTNTLNVGLVHDAMVGYMIDRCRTEGVALRSVNPVVCECNDASLNDIQHRAERAKHVLEAIRNASAVFEEGAVGCGRGTTCHGLKGGVGTASRVVRMPERDYTVGLLVQTNHGRFEDLLIQGRHPDAESPGRTGAPDQGSCIAILATDAPLSDRQLKRVVKRISVGLARLGSFIGHGSGEVFIGFSTYRPEAVSESLVRSLQMREERLDPFFRAAAECAEEAVLNSMIAAEDVTGSDGTARRSLRHLLRPIETD